MVLVADKQKANTVFFLSLVFAGLTSIFNAVFTVFYFIIAWVLSKRRWTVGLSYSIIGYREALPLDSSQQDEGGGL